MANKSIDLTKLKSCYFKPGFDQLYSHQVVDGYYDSINHRFYTKEDEYFWEEDNVLEFKLRK